MKQETKTALQELLDAFVKARVLMDHNENDMNSFRILLRYETKIQLLKQELEASV
jgi:hypothetical protein